MTATEPGPRVCAGRCGRPLVPQHATPGPGEARHASRGLCQRCRRAIVTGTIEDFPRVYRSRDEVLDEWVRLRGELTRREFAEHVGMTYGAVSSVLFYARADGDERARP